VKGRVLITGGAGFIGSHLADELIAAGYGVRVLDALDPQVHGLSRQPPEYLDPGVELQIGDVGDPAAVRRALDGIDGVIHLAAAVGVGQSMYEIARYTRVNSLGTAVVVEALLERSIGKLVVASSMSIYGEGLYRGPDGLPFTVPRRPRSQLLAGEWELRDGEGMPLVPVPTPEWKAPDIASVYALTKLDQERICLLVGEAYGVPAVALRFFNTYGPRQALSNPYTGVLAIFAARLLNDAPPLVFEDGRQQRDFVSVHDVARACRLAYESERAGEVYNVGSGMAQPIVELAQRTARVLGKERIEPRVTGKYRVGDIRHCTADISRARRDLGYEPQVGLDEGLAELAEWLAGRSAEDRVQEAGHELAARGLTL